MTINFYCPVCSAPIRGVPDEAARRLGTCLNCGSRIPVPGARRVNDDDIIAILGPVHKDIQQLSSPEETVSDSRSDKLRQKHAGQNAVEESVAGETNETRRSGSDRSLISRGRAVLRSLFSRMHHFDLRFIRRRSQLRSLLRRGERFIVESDAIVLTNQRLLDLISHVVLELETFESAFAFDTKTSSDLILHSENERHVFFALDRLIVHSVVESIRTMLSVERGSPGLPKSARESSDLYDVVFGTTTTKVHLPLAAPEVIGRGFTAATTGEARLGRPATERMVNRPQTSSDSGERARMSAMSKLRGNGYRIESPLEAKRVVRALRNCDIPCLSRLVDDSGNMPLRCAALAALRDLGSIAAAALPTLRRLLDSEELSIKRYNATQDDLLLLTVVSETYLAVSSGQS